MSTRRFWRRRSERDFENEVASHLALEADRLAAGGVNADDAGAAARRAFGNVTGVREQFRERQRGVVFEQLAQDLGYALRSARRSPGFTGIAVLCLAVGIAVNTAAFSVLNALLFRDFPGVERQAELVSVRLGHEASWGRTSAYYPSRPDYEILRAALPALSGAMAAGRAQVAVRTTGEPRVVASDIVSENFFAVLNTTPVRGRFFDARDFADDAGVVVVSAEFAADALGGIDRATGQRVTVGTRVFTVIGVTPPGFFGLSPGDLLDSGRGGPALFLPLSAAASVRTASRGPPELAINDTWLQITGRIAPNATLAKVRAQATRAAATIAQLHPVARSKAFVEIGRVGSNGDTIAGVAFVMAVPLIVLLIVCANLANQLLARAVHRSREVAVRLSLGATRARLVRQLLTESTLLAVVAGALSLLFARMLLDALRAFFLSLSFRIPIDAPVLLFTLGIAIATAMVFGLAPALRATRGELVGALKHGSPGSGAGGSRLRSALVVFQVAASCALMALTGVFVRAGQQSRRPLAELPPQNLMAVEVDLDLLGYDMSTGRAFLSSAMDRIRAMPGVDAVAVAPFEPTSSGPERPVAVPGSEGTRYVDVADVSGDWFAASDIKPLRGRLFTSAEAAGAPTVAVVDEAFVRRHMSGEDPLGRSLRIGADSSATVATVIGVVPSRLSREGRQPEGMVILPGTNHYQSHTFLYVRTRANVEAMRAPVRAALHGLDPRLPIVSLRTARETRARDFTPVRLLASGVGTLGTLALGLAALGLFSVLSFMVAQRTREIGVRLALGAPRAAVTRMVIAQTIKLAGIGVLIGGTVAVAIATLLRALLYGLAPIDPIAFGSAGAVMLAVALLASLIPARRASAVDPLVALRAE